MKSVDVERTQRPAVLVIFTEDTYRGSASYELDLKFPPQYIPKQYRQSLLMDTPGAIRVIRPVESPAMLKRDRWQLLGASAGSFCSASNGATSVIIPLNTPAERSSPRRQLANPVRRSLFSGYFSPVSLLSNSSGPTCRICFEGNTKEELISPCNCCGSVELVHQSCLEKWLSTSDKKSCEICKHRYDVTHERRPFWKWFASRDPNNGPGGCYADMIGVLILCSLCLMSVYMCGLGAANYLSRGNAWKGYALLTLCVCLMILCFLFLFVTLKFHWAALKRWQTSNQLVRLVDWKVRRDSSEHHEAHSKRQIPQSTSHQIVAASERYVASPCATIDVELSFRTVDSST